MCVCVGQFVCTYPGNNGFTKLKAQFDFRQIKIRTCWELKQLQMAPLSHLVSTSPLALREFPLERHTFLANGGWTLLSASIALPCLPGPGDCIITEDEVILQHKGRTGAENLIRTGWMLLEEDVNVPLGPKLSSERNRSVFHKI